MDQVDEILEYATFLADFPDDQVEEDGEVVKPGGAAIAEHLRAAIAKRGWTTTAVYQHSFYGWAFDVNIDGVRIWCMTQNPNPWLLITELRGRFFARLLGRAPDSKHRAALGALRETLAGPPFSAARWTTRAEYESQVASSADDGTNEV